MTMTSSKLFAAALAVAALTSGCATTQMDTPAGFAAHERDDRYELRVSDGEGVVLAVRTEKNRPQGDLPYWTSALDAQLRQAGYEANAARDITSADGHAGKQLRYVLTDGGRQLVFWMTVFVTGRHVVVVEAGGDASFFEPKADAVDSAISTLNVG